MGLGKSRFVEHTLLLDLSFPPSWRRQVCAPAPELFDARWVRGPTRDSPGPWATPGL